MSKDLSYIINEDGEAIYYGVIFSADQKKYYLNELICNVEWVNERLTMFGKDIITKRKVAFYADNGIEYTYSKQTKKGLPWTPLLLEIKNLVEHYTQTTYNACLLNLYHDGNEGMGWHADDEKEIMPNSSIASLSIGAERKFVFKHKSTTETISLLLENGSLLEMKGTIQNHWLHALPKTKKVTVARINLTFRQMI